MKASSMPGRSARTCRRLASTPRVRWITIRISRAERESGALRYSRLRPTASETITPWSSRRRSSLDTAPGSRPIWRAIARTWPVAPRRTWKKRRRSFRTSDAPPMIVAILASYDARMATVLGDPGLGEFSADPVRPAERHEAQPANDTCRHVIPGRVEGDRDPEEPHRLHPRRHETPEIRAHPAAAVTLEINLVDEHGGHEHRRQESDEQPGVEVVPPEEVDRDEGGREIGEELGRVDLVIERALEEAHLAPVSGDSVRRMLARCSAACGSTIRRRTTSAERRRFSYSKTSRDHASSFIRLAIARSRARPSSIAEAASSFDRVAWSRAMIAFSSCVGSQAKMNGRSPVSARAMNPACRRRPRPM